MAEAVEIIQGCVRGIWAEQFEPTGERVQYDDYEMILQSGVASRLMNEVDASTRVVKR